MKLREILETINYKEITEDHKDIEIRNITIDSRTVRHGSLFVCIKGLKTDGHDYIPQAIEKGAAAVLCERTPEGIPQNTAIIVTTDSRGALAKAAGNFYGNPQHSLKMIGVTGTKGKTSITYFMETILSHAGRKCGVIGTSGAVVDGKDLGIPYLTATTPDTIELYQILAKMKAMGVTDVIMEVSSHALELRRVEGIQYETGIFTNLTHAHFDFHGTFENYLNAKAKLFTISNHGIVNIDSAYGEQIIQKSACPVQSYALEHDADYLAKNIISTQASNEFDLTVNGNQEHFYLHVPGLFSVSNCLACIAACLTLGISVETIREGVAKIKGVPGRIQAIPNKKGFNVFVDYAHTPDSLENIVKAVRAFTTGRIITVFGCGGDRDATMRPAMGKVAGELSDICILTSDNPRNEKPEYIINQIEQGITNKSCDYLKITDRKKAIFEAVGLAAKNDSIIIAGKGHEDYQEFENKRRIYFDDAVVAQEALEARC